MRRLRLYFLNANVRALRARLDRMVEAEKQLTAALDQVEAFGTPTPANTQAVIEATELLDRESFQIGAGAKRLRAEYLEELNLASSARLPQEVGS